MKTKLYLVILLVICVLSIDANNVFQKRKYTNFKKGRAKTEVKKIAVNKAQQVKITKVEERVSEILVDNNPSVNKPERIEKTIKNNDFETVKLAKKSKKMHNSISVNSNLEIIKKEITTKAKIETSKKHTAISSAPNPVKPYSKTPGIILYSLLGAIATIGLAAGFYYAFVNFPVVFWVLIGVAVFTTVFALISEAFGGSSSTLWILVALIGLTFIIFGLIYLFPIPGWGLISAIAICAIALFAILAALLSLQF